MSEIKKEWSCKPGSVIAHKCRDDHLSRLYVAIQLKRPTWRRTGQVHGLLFGLASDGVYNASCVTTRPVVSYTAFSPLPSGNAERLFVFCCTFPGVASAGRYPASCPVKPGLSSRICVRSSAPLDKGL